MGGLVVRPRSSILRGHDWVYANEILKVFGDPAPGSVVSLRDGRDRFLGSAIYNPSSKIPARRFSRRRQAIDCEFLERRVLRALEWRQRHSRPELCRLIWGEADGLPGVIADRYGPVVVLQTNTLALDAWKNDLARILASQPGIHAVLEKNDSPSRHLEGMDHQIGPLLGEVPATMEVSADGVSFEVHFREGHKTGLYLDQLDSYRVVGEYAAGRRVLDCFSNAGGFALHAAAAGAAGVTAIESGEGACRMLERNAGINRAEIRVVRADVLEELPRLERRREEYDLIILDPPSFTRTRGKSGDALRGYRDLHRVAAELMAPRALMATFCCAHHISLSEFQQAVASGFHDARRSGRILGTFDQPIDHPVAIHLPETAYLKGLLLCGDPAF